MIVILLVDDLPQRPWQDTKIYLTLRAKYPQLREYTSLIMLLKKQRTSVRCLKIDIFECKPAQSAEIDEAVEVKSTISALDGSDGVVCINQRGRQLRQCDSIAGEQCVL
jgi:hypothetical protein